MGVDIFAGLIVVLGVLVLGLVLKSISATREVRAMTSRVSDLEKAVSKPRLIENAKPAKPRYSTARQDGARPRSSQK